VRTIIAGSNLVNRSEDVHDPYSVRCIPQVHGAVRNILQFVEKTLTNQLRTVDDDPVFFTDVEVRDCPPLDNWEERLHFEHGHFHGAPIGYASDLLAVAMADLCSISERRTQMLLDVNHNRGLPACLVDNPRGSLSGLMVAQYTAASLVSENKSLAHPASVDSIPTSANSEDHVSMGTIAARKARRIVDHASTVLALEFLCAVHALAFRIGELMITDPSTGARRTVKVTGSPGERTQRLYDLAHSQEAFSLLEARDDRLHGMLEPLRRLMESPRVLEGIL
jgi:histidine ammonia-lyase